MIITCCLDGTARLRPLGASHLMLPVQHNKFRRKATLWTLGVLLAAWAQSRMDWLRFGLVAGRNWWRGGGGAIAPVAPPQAWAHCEAEELARELTAVVTVKDACSHWNDFVVHWGARLPRQTRVIYAYPDFPACHQQVAQTLEAFRTHFDRAEALPLPFNSSPMQGWWQAAPMLRTRYALLMHNDVYEVANSSCCWLLRALQEDSLAAAAAPSIFETRDDGSLAFHTTQSRLHLRADGSGRGLAPWLLHEHDFAVGMNRGADLPMGPQNDFIEDHAFLVRSSLVRSVVDPAASFTMEYLDMILSIRGMGMHVTYVPAAQIEFRVTGFDASDLPYFVYKRSNAVAHGTRHYLGAKWGVQVPNLAFWAFIRETVLAGHRYAGSGEQGALLLVSLLQAVGFDRYACGPHALSFAEVVRSPRETVLGRSCTAVSRRQVDAHHAASPRGGLRATAVLSVEPAVGKGAPGAMFGVHLPHFPAFGIVELAVSAWWPPERLRACNALFRHQPSGARRCWLVVLPHYTLGPGAVAAATLVLQQLGVSMRVLAYAQMLWNAGAGVEGPLAPFLRLQTLGLPAVRQVAACPVDRSGVLCAFNFHIEEVVEVEQWHYRPLAMAQLRELAGVLRATEEPPPLPL